MGNAQEIYPPAVKRTPQEVAAICGLSQRKIFLAFGISRITWTAWQMETRTISPYEWLAIQHVLGIYAHPAARPESDLTTDDKETALSRTPREIASALGVTMKRFAESLFIPYATVRDWSTGRRKPTPHLYLALQAVLGLYRHPAAKLKSTPTH